MAGVEGVKNIASQKHQVYFLLVCDLADFLQNQFLFGNAGVLLESFA
jgi:hypothetical protein